MTCLFFIGRQKSLVLCYDPTKVIVLGKMVENTVEMLLGVSLFFFLTFYYYYL
jgi:hypothetical protein